jgi:hypothetical protein
VTHTTACRQYTSALQAIKENFEKGVAAKLRHHVPIDEKERNGRPLLPRLVRLAVKFGMSDKEKLALNFIIVQAIGTATHTIESFRVHSSS